MPGVIDFSKIKYKNDIELDLQIWEVNKQEYLNITKDFEERGWQLSIEELLKYLMFFQIVKGFYGYFTITKDLIRKIDSNLSISRGKEIIFIDNKQYCIATFLLINIIPYLNKKIDNNFYLKDISSFTNNGLLQRYFIYRNLFLINFKYDDDIKYNKLITESKENIKNNPLDMVSGSQTKNQTSNKEKEINILKKKLEPNLKDDIINPKIKKINIIPHKQLILFGCPGTGKSHKVNNQYCEELSVDNNSENCIRTVFHPEYDYGDFMGKLLPITKNNKVEYNYYPGHFMKALIASYKNILASVNNKKVEWGEVKNVCLIIDELNRGNTSSIFGNVFQLLDRNNNGEKKGWSTYGVSIADIEFEKLIDELGFNRVYENESIFFRHNYKNLDIKDSLNIKDLEDLIKNYLDIQSSNKIKIPPNLSILCTMNNADTSIYQLDNAFKRRWDMEYVDIHNEIENRKIENNTNWKQFVDNINKFISKNANQLKNVEDKLIGYYFIGEEIIKKESIKNKLMFYLWDTVFYNNKKPLEELLKTQTQNKSLLTFGDFQKQFETFITEIYNYK